VVSFCIAIDSLYKLHRRADAHPVPGRAIALIEGDLLFFNADHVQAQLVAIPNAMPADTPLAGAAGGTIQRLTTR